ncbi:hypothetical protein [Pseudoprimorskyibacter insulae]|uniref:Uncharacterized protein n=1 Tax=Pseudoprimorskyibacter insulae TaxID=1695997 RepID=A0A2R8AZ28_9RHOB|nr:hypothetical protein [Pseudoprimorskyibacter insulae]SPF81104.1 hypothetical protein PRI8871_02922 [Pseudoprimorskyibacter insulae]
MNFIADLFLAAGAFGAGIYCFVLSRRLNQLTNLESGVGNAVTTLAKQVDDLEKAVDMAQNGAENSSRSLQEITTKAEQTALRLELLLASMHDFPSEKVQQPASDATFVRHRVVSR